MSNSRNLADLLENDGDVKSGHLDEVDGLPSRSTHAGKYLKVKADNSTTEWSALSVGDGGLTQKNFTTADNTKLDGIAASANNYSHPATHAASMLTGALPAIDGSSLTGIDALPTQTGHTGKYLGTDGSAATWNTLDTDANSTTKGLYEHANTISANYSITSGNNAMTAGPITINTGISVTIPTGSTWVIA